MKKRIIKTFEQHLIDYELAKDLVNGDPKNSLTEARKNKYERLYLDYLLMKDVVKEEINESSFNDVIDSIDSNDFIDDPELFYDSYTSSKRISYLTPYTIDDLKEFKLFKLRNYKIGFAIKNGDIILVHNNESVGGIGDILMQKAIEFGGTHLDHFDGYLTGFYKRNRFKLRNNDHFNDLYAPEDWEYESINVYDPNKSIYPEELKTSTTDIKLAEKRYDSGRPDVVYRVLR